MNKTEAPDRNLNLYTGKPQHQNFCCMRTFFPAGEMLPSSSPHVFPQGPTLQLPESFQFEAEQRNTEDLLSQTDTSALLVLVKGELRFEQYRLTGGPDVQWISWSVAKSFVSALTGIAIAEGFINSIEDPIQTYVPGLVDTVYDGVRIKDVLQMSSGVRWNEDYSDADSDISRFGAAITAGGSLDDFVAGMHRDAPAGTLCQYNSADTQALGSLVVGATGESLTSYMQKKICDPLGFSSSSAWLLDGQGMEMAFGGLNLTAQDFAKIGELYRNKGTWQGRQIVPESWVTASVQPDAPHLKAGKVLVGGHVLPLGYGYQWWVPAGDRGEFSAIGVYNQFIYVDPSREVVIVKLSANREYGTSTEESTNREMETIELLRAIAAITN